MDIQKIVHDTRVIPQAPTVVTGDVVGGTVAPTPKKTEDEEAEEATDQQPQR